MSPVDPGELASVAFSGEPGVYAMLHCYFDDSGSHADSRMAVWGGVAGATGHFIELNEKWRRLLKEPLPGKPPLSKFGLADCRWGRGEFFGYSEGERDRARFLFRQVILDSGVHPFSFAVDKKAWDSIVTGAMMDSYGCGASGVAFSACADVALRLAQSMPNNHMACVFDRGQRNAETLSLIEDAESRADAANIPITFTFAKVVEVTGLQAADTIATEHYWYCGQCLDSPRREDVPIPPHLAYLVTRRKTRAYLMLRPQILDLRRRFRALSKAG